jgi:hypothetical protein
MGAKLPYIDLFICLRQKTMGMSPWSFISNNDLKCGFYIRYPRAL